MSGSRARKIRKALSLAVDLNTHEGRNTYRKIKKIWSQRFGHS